MGGEHSITTPETRVIDRESGSRVVCKLASEFTAGGLGSSAGGVVRRSSSSSSSSSDEKRRVDVVVVVVEGGDASGELSECEKRDGKEKRKWRERVRKRSGGIVGGSLLGRLVFLVLSLLEASGGCSSSVSTSRGPLLVSSRCALVSLLVVGLFLRPCIAVPTTSSSSSGSGNLVAASGYHSGNGEATTLTRIMLERHREPANPVDLGGEYQEANFESDVEATMNRRRLRVEDPRYQHDDDYHDRDYQLTPLLQHPRESGLERRSRLREPELDTIRRSIVEGLGLERIPDPSKANVSQTEYRRAHQEYLTRLHSRAGKEDRIRRLYTFHAAERSPSTLVNRTRRGAYGSSASEDRLVPSNSTSGVLFFPLEIPEDDTLVDHANLRLLLDPAGTSVDEESHVVSVYRIAADSRHFVSRQSFPPGGRGRRWIELDATELASLWHEYGVENLGVEVRFERSNTGDVFVQPEILEPALNVFTATFSMEDHDSRNSRRKRRASPEHLMSLHKGRRTECRGENKKCCRHQMTVIFKDLEGFEFIVQPKSFDAGYCKGRCPPRYNPAHHHALLQSLIWKEDKRKAPRPCCAPSKLDELEILYFDENDPTKLKVSSWKNMKVLECACS